MMKKNNKFNNNSNYFLFLISLDKFQYIFIFYSVKTLKIIENYLFLEINLSKKIFFH